YSAPIARDRVSRISADAGSVANAGTADIGERPRVVVLLPLDQAEGRRPAPVGVADRVPQVAVDHTHHLKGTANAGTADIGERPRVVVLLPLDQAEGRRPAPVEVADRVPQVAVDHTHHLKGTANTGTADIGEHPR